MILQAILVPAPLHPPPDAIDLVGQFSKAKPPIHDAIQIPQCALYCYCATIRYYSYCSSGSTIFMFCVSGDPARISVIL